MLHYPMTCMLSDRVPFLHLHSEEFLFEARLGMRIVDDHGFYFANVMDGLSDREAIIASISTVFRMPDLPSTNWFELKVGLRDLDWLPYRGYALLLEKAEDLLALPEEDWKEFFAILKESTEYWNNLDCPFHISLIGSERLERKIKATTGMELHMHDRVIHGCSIPDATVIEP